MASAYVQGIQSEGVGACMKHYLVNSQETRRTTISSEVDERTLREIYLPAFERTVKKAHPGRLWLPTTGSTGLMPRRIENI